MAATEIQIHQAQAKILRTLLFKTEVRFRDLNIDKLGTDHFSFHLKQLIDQGVLEKIGTKYRLTANDIEFANRFDTEKVAVEKQAKIGVLIVPIKGDKGATKYLSQVRLKHPYYGFRGCITGKIRWGDTVLETAARELKEETGLTGNLKFIGIEHKMDYSQKTGEMLEDKFFYIVKATRTKGRLIESFEGGKNCWLTEKEIVSDPKVFEDVPKVLRNLRKNKFFFLEDSYIYSDEQY
jgi:ADP-ribose pyrophosphatase YjhB (NUDIX family)